MTMSQSAGPARECGAGLRRRPGGAQGAFAGRRWRRGPACRGGCCTGPAGAGLPRGGA